MNDAAIKAQHVLDKMLDLIDKGVDAAPTLINELAKEYAVYYVIEEFPVISLSFLFVFIATGIYAATRKNEDVVAASGVLFALAIISGGFVFDGLKAAAQAAWAPKAFLVEKLRGK